MAHHVTIELDDDSEMLRIDDFSTGDPDITKYFADVEPDVREAKLETALRVGVLALRSSETVEDVDYVEKRFQKLQQTFDTRIEELLGEEGEVQSYVKEHFGEDGKLVSEVFDPSDDSTPIGQLKQTMDKNIQELRTDLQVAAKEEEMVESTRLKGEQFEEDLYEFLADIASTTGDRVEKTGTTAGLLGDSKKGDFVLELDEASAKVVVEAKDSYYSQPKIEAEMEEALENRGASYGLFVARSIENVPDHVGWFNEYNQNQLVIALSDGEDESRAEELLRVGYKWARMRTFQQHAATGDDIELGNIQDEIESAERALKSFQKIKGKCTTIEGAANDIRTETDEIRSELDACLDGINTELAAARTAAADD